MSMKKTDLEKHLAKKLDGRMKTAGAPKRYGQGAAAPASAKAPAAASDPTKLVSVACRLPADLLNRARARAETQDGGFNALMATAVQAWLDSDKDQSGGG